jgi:uncharacterized protein (DUF1015 family)
MIRPFKALRPLPADAQAVVAPPYDVVSVDEARALADGRPSSFLHISRPEIDLPPGTDPHGDAAYARGAGSLARLIGSGVLVRDQRPAYYVYRMHRGAHTQTGVALIASVRAYDAHRVRRHELTRPDKENDRVRNIDSLNAQTGPVLCAYRADAGIDTMLAALAAGEPLLSATGQHDVEHVLWRVDTPEAVTALDDRLNALAALYIADGHHRSAAAARVAAARRSADPLASHEYFLCVAFPHDQMRIFDYNRVVADLNGLGKDGFLAAAGREFDITAADRAQPSAPHEFAMYLDGQWLRLRPKAPPPSDPVLGLDVSILQQRLIEPVLGIEDPRTDARIDFVGGVRGLAGLEARVDGGSAAVAFALYPTQMEQLMAVADANALMPPKSTWFEPKLADGLVSHVLD